MSDRCRVEQRWGHQFRNQDITWNHRETKEVAGSTARRYVRELKQWASGLADLVRETSEDGVRVITAHHWVNGFENIRQLRIG